MTIDWNTLDPTGALFNIRNVIEYTLSNIVEETASLIDIVNPEQTVINLNNALDIALRVSDTPSYDVGFVSAVLATGLQRGTVTTVDVAEEWIIQYPGDYITQYVVSVDENRALTATYEESTTKWRFGLVTKKLNGKMFDNVYYSPNYDDVIMQLKEKTISGVRAAYGMYKTYTGKYYVIKAELNADNTLPDLSTSDFEIYPRSYETALQWLCTKGELQVAIDSFWFAGYAAYKAALDKSNNISYTYPPEIEAAFI